MKAPSSFNAFAVEPRLAETKPNKFVEHPYELMQAFSL